MQKQLTSRLNGSMIVAANVPYCTRLSVANGSFMSKLSYMICFYVVQAEAYLLKNIQVIQSRASADMAHPHKCTA